MKKHILGRIVAVTMLAVPLLIGAGVLEDSMETMKIENMGNVINTEGDEFFPTITEDGKTMVFSLRKKNDKNSDIYETSFENGAWTKPKELNIINSRMDDQTPCISGDGKMLVFSSNREGSLRPPKKSGESYYLTNDLYVSYLNERVNQWTEPVAIKGDVNTIDNERAPSFGRDASVIYFSRYSGNEIEKSVIYSARLENGKYVGVKPLPHPVNTGNSDFGFMPSKSREGFYLSSNRPGGFGMWDIYYVHFENGEFTGVVNLGKPTNSTSNELSITEVGNTIYFCSDREGGMGGTDIYSITLAPKVFAVKKDLDLECTVVEKKTGKPVSAKFSVQMVEEGNVEGADAGTVESTSDAKGAFSLKIKPEVRSVVVKPLDPKIKSFSRKIDLNKDGTTKATIEVSFLGEAKPEKTVEIPAVVKFDFRPVYFSNGSHHLSPSYYPYLHTVLVFLRNNPDVKLLISGFASRQGGEESNINLSHRRAEAVYRYFVNFGIDGERLNYRGEGTGRPVLDGEDRYRPWLNRRVEFRIINQ
jgi:outer membrane protein OmpA-like peptidoglycan-associated protein